MTKKTRAKRRPIDRAMSQERPEKLAMRKIWVGLVNEYLSSDQIGPDETVFLTLSGEEAKDIEMLVDSGIIDLSEVSGISSDSLRKIVVIESNSQAEAKIRKKYPGLKVLRQSFSEIVSGNNPIRYPRGDFERYCRARVINLDLNKSLSDNNGQFDIFSWIVKLCNIHATGGRNNWSLCLTLHGEIKWSSIANEQVKHFLCENFSRSGAFRESSEQLLGEGLISSISEDVDFDFGLCSRDDQQKVLMLYVPKNIIHLTHSSGWRISTRYNLRYGSEAHDHAPMVTWIFDFRLDNRAHSTPGALYSQCLELILAQAGFISDRGELVFQ